MRSIDGTSVERIYGRTQPVTIKLAAGTPGEVSLRAARGFLVVKGDDAYSMYDLVIGRQLLDQVSGFVVPVTQQFFYFPHLTRRDISTLHALPVITGKASPGHALTSSAAALDDALSFMPACCAALQDDAIVTDCAGSDPAQQKQQRQPEPAAKPVAKRRAGSKPAPTAVTGSTQAQPWGVLLGLVSIILPALLVMRGMPRVAKRTSFGRALLHVLAVLFHGLAFIFRPATWLTRKAGECLGQGWLCCARVAAITKPWVCTTYLKLGRRGCYYSVDGKTYVVATGPGGSTNSNFRVLDIYKQAFSWRMARRVMPARTLMLLLLLMLTCLSSVAAVHMHHSATAPSNPTRWALQQLMPLPLPYTTFPLLVAELSDEQASYFR